MKCSISLAIGGETHSDSGKETLGHVGHDDTDEEDDRVQPVVTQDEGNDEEADTEEDSDPGDDVDEVLDLLGNGGLTSLQTGGKSSNPAHHGVVPDVDHHPDGGALDSVGGEERQVLRLERVLVGEFGASRL